MKRGQATLFVIIGILIVTLVAVSYSYRDEISSKASNLGLIKTATLPPQFEEKKEEIENCLSSVLSEAIASIAIRGGIIESTDSLNADGLLIKYYFDKGETRAPSKEAVAKEIGTLLDLDAVLCPTVLGLNEAKRSQSEITLEEGKVSAKITMPVTFEINGVTETVKEFNVNTKIRLSELLDAAEEIASTTDADGICITCINDIAEEKNIKVEIEPYEDSVIITIIDATSQVDGKPLKLSFAVRY